MRAHEFITEAATDIVYHYMPTHDAVRTLSDNHYSLESSTGMDVEEKMMPPGKHWYLATTRSKVGDYHVQKANDSGAMFVLDGRWLNNNYETKPVDYWSMVPHNLKRGDWKNIPAERKRSMFASDPSRTSESEDRVFSKSNAIPLRGSTLAIHVFVRPVEKLPSYSDPERRGYRAAEIRRIIELGAARDIPVYLYDNKQSWMSQREQYRIDPNSQYGKALLSGKPVTPYFRPTRTDLYYNSPTYWIELINKDPVKDKLSDKADKLRYNLNYYSDTVSGLQNDMHNAARDPSNPEYQLLIPINDFMSKNRIANLKQLQDYLKKKWSDTRS
jgi:hypothetical protein